MIKSYSRKLIMLFLCILTHAVFAEKINFKQPLEPQQGWLLYALTILALLVLSLLLAKRMNQSTIKQSACRLIDKKRLGNKTFIYVFEYQNQRFLLADNQQSLAIQTLSKEVVDEKN